MKVLIPLDGSTDAERSLGWLPLLARVGKLNARLLAVVNERQSMFSSLPESLRERERNILSAYLAAKTEQVRATAASVETVVATGSPAGVILEEAERNSVDLVIINTHGRSGLERWRLGSVADKVVRAAVCDTLVIGPEATTPQTLRAVLVPLDGSQHAEEALPVAQRLAGSHGAKMHLLTVVPPVVLATRFEDLRQQLLDEGLARANAYLGGLQAHLGEVKLTVLSGPPVQTIMEYSTENSIDLVVATSHGHGGVSRAVLGSVTDRLLSGRVPILVVHS